MTRTLKPTQQGERGRAKGCCGKQVKEPKQRLETYRTSLHIAESMAWLQQIHVPVICAGKEVSQNGLL